MTLGVWESERVGLAPPLELRFLTIRTAQPKSQMKTRMQNVAPYT